MAALSPMPSGLHLERCIMSDRSKDITFMGKLFYLDLPHNKQTLLLTKAICRLGGVIEGFLSRDVNYVVTGNRKAANIANGGSSIRKEGTQRPNTQKIEVRPHLHVKTPYSRGKQLLKKVVQSQECSSILSSARSWGVCILRVDEVLEYLECSTQRQANWPNKGKGPSGAGQTLKVGKLKSPFLKIEDQSRKYRPIHCSFSNFPECLFISSDRSPFETARTNNSTHKDRDPGEQDNEDERPQNWEKSGYCECCQMTYTKLSEHLISEQHVLFALNASNYRVIDDITSHIFCDLVPLPYGFKPSEERCDNKSPPQSSEEPPLQECLEKKELGQDESTEEPVDHSAELAAQEHNLVLREQEHLKQDAACPTENHSLEWSNDSPVENIVMDQEHAENLLVPQCTVSTTDVLVQCDLPLADTCDAGEVSRMGLVTEVSWYTEEAGLTSLYTVQSLVISPGPVLEEHPELAMDPGPVLEEHPELAMDPGPVLEEHPELAMDPGPVLEEHPELAMDPGPVLEEHPELALDPGPVLEEHPELAVDSASVEPPLFISALGDPLHALAQGGLCGSSPEAVQQDPITSAHMESQMINTVPHQTNELLADGPQVTPSVGLYAEPSTAPATAVECTSHGSDTALGAAVPLESAVGQHQHVLLLSTQNTLLVNAPCDLETELSNNLSIPQLTLAPWHPPAEDTVTVTAPLGNLVEGQDPEPMLPNTDCCGGKRKHCWSPCHPPAKRQPSHCQSMPMWVFHQLPSSMNQPAIPVFSDWVDRDGSHTAAEGECSPPTLCFNPKLAQYEASSESDWDSQLASQCQNNPQQTAHVGDLRTAQVSLDESWYGKQLCSALAHEQTLGSPSSTQTVTLSHSPYDVYLSGAAS